MCVVATRLCGGLICWQFDWVVYVWFGFVVVLVCVDDVAIDGVVGGGGGALVVVVVGVMCVWCRVRLFVSVCGWCCVRWCECVCVCLLA